MERKLPKNVRQIGNVSDNPKIYVEDYVDTFLIQLCEQTKDEPQGAFLIGDIQSEEGQDYIFIYGAVRMHGLKKDGNNPVINDEIWKRAYEDCKQYFEEGEMLGWFLTVPAGEVVLTAEMKKIHKKSFPKKNTILILEEPTEKEESYFANKYNELMSIGGHYVYYEKNPCMQNYMISCRKKNGVSPSETVEDRAAKDFRSLIRTREEAKEQKKISKFLYVTSGILVLIVIVLGVTTMNNFDKMKSVESMMKSMSGSTEVSSAASSAAKEAVSSVADKQADASEETSTQTDEQTDGKTSAQKSEQTDEQDSEQSNKQNSEQSDEQTDKQTNKQTNSQGEGDTQEDTSNGSNGVYVVEKGDTLAIISQKCYGNVNHIDAICRMNGLTDSNLIYVGQKLLLP